MPTEVVAAIIAAVAAGGTAVYSADQSRKRSHEATDAAKAAQDKQLAAEKAAAAPKQFSVTPDIAEQVKAKIAAMNAAAGGGGISPDFLTAGVEQDFPSAPPDILKGLVNDALSGKSGGF